MFRLVWAEVLNTQLTLWGALLLYLFAVATLWFIESRLGRLRRSEDAVPSSSLVDARSSVTLALSSFLVVTTFVVVASVFAIFRHLFANFHLEFVYAILQLLIPLAASLAVRGRAQSQTIGQRLPLLDCVRSHSRLFVIAAVGYGVTTVAGVPTVINDQTNWAIAECHRVYSENGTSCKDGLPRTETYAAFPLFPGAVLVYHSYTIAPLYGLEAWSLFLWYGGQPVTLGRWALSVS